MVNINKSKALELHNAGFKWSGHTHPGEGVNVKMPSDGDLYILEQFKQKGVLSWIVRVRLHYLK